MSDAKKFKYSDHPSITMVAKKPHLRIFEDFAIEEKLPKFDVKVNASNAYADHTKPSSSDGNIIVSDDMVNSSAPRFSSSDTESRDMYELKRVLEGLGEHVSTISSARWDRERYIRNKLNEIRNEERGSKSEYPAIGKPTKSMIGTIRGLFKRKTDVKDAPEHESKPMFEYDVEEAFNRIKDSFTLSTTDTLEKCKRIVDATIERLNAAGQYQKANEIASSAFVIANELSLAADGRFAKYLTEAQLIDFMLKSEKGINVEFLRYYGELMPKDVIDKKIEADGLMVFDNYAVIHYDTTIERFNQIVTSEEEERARRLRRDPILVGLIQGSRKLYYICDWVTKEDDLTLEKVESVIGKKVSIIDRIDQHYDDEKKHLDELVGIVNDMHNKIMNVNSSVEEDAAL